MNRAIIALILFQSIFFIGCHQSDRGILNKTVKTLNSLDRIEYKASRTLDDVIIKTKDTVICYFDFESNDTLVGAKYQFATQRYEEIYNGKNGFSVNREHGLILFSNQPTKESLANSMFMINSLHRFKELLPAFLKDTSASIARQKDTLINGENNYNFAISFKNPPLIGELFRRQKLISACNLLISQKNLLPAQITYTFAGEPGSLKTDFLEINLKATRPDSIWNLEGYPEEYSRKTYKEWEEASKTRISGQVGEKAPDWKLPLMSGDSVRLSDFKNNLVLLEFWFPYCSGCVESIPHLNEIQEIYSKKGLKIYGIEYTKFKGNGIAEYIEKHDIKYPILHSGKLVMNWYGIQLAPTFFLIDKKGTIVYTSKGFDKKELVKAIKNNI